MRHVFVETNWVVAYAAPIHLQSPAAAKLAEEAAGGRLRLYVPAPCLTEARQPLRTRFQPRLIADAIRKYLEWATREGGVDHQSAQTMRRLLDQCEAAVSSELDQLDDRLRALVEHPGIEVYGLSETMLARAVHFSTLNLELKPFDQAILAAVLVRAEQLRDDGADELAFCELDSDLRPWDKNGRAKQPLTSLYDSAHLWVYGDFAMESPRRRPTFPEQSNTAN